MAEREPLPNTLRPDPLILSSQDMDVLLYILPPTELTRFEQANRGELNCLVCDQPVLGLVMIAEEYEGLTLVCLACGYCEY